MSRTDAPALMSASACVCIVWTLPCALSILNWSEPRPAASNAFLRNGASYWTYRVEVVVSGRRTPINPVPEEARSLSCAMTEKSAVKSPAAIVGTEADDPGAEELLLDDELHAASTVPINRTAAAAVNVLIGDLIDDPFRSGPRTKRPLAGSFSSRPSPPEAAARPHPRPPNPAATPFIRNSTGRAVPLRRPPGSTAGSVRPIQALAEASARTDPLAGTPGSAHPGRWRDRRAPRRRPRQWPRPSAARNVRARPGSDRAGCRRRR